MNSRIPYQLTDADYRSIIDGIRNTFNRYRYMLLVSVVAGKQRVDEKTTRNKFFRIDCAWYDHKTRKVVDRYSSEMRADLQPSELCRVSTNLVGGEVPHLREVLNYISEKNKNLDGEIAWTTWGRGERLKIVHALKKAEMFDGSFAELSYFDFKNTFSQADLVPDRTLGQTIGDGAVVEYFIDIDRLQQAYRLFHYRYA